MSCPKEMLQIYTEGIPTGGCDSRQTADCTLHWLLVEIKGDIPTWYLIQLFKRFIDDIFGIWIGTRNQFDEFVVQLNHQTQKYEILFGEYSIGEWDEVHFLDVTLLQSFWIVTACCNTGCIGRRPTQGITCNREVSIQSMFLMQWLTHR